MKHEDNTLQQNLNHICDYITDDHNSQEEIFFNDYSAQLVWFDQNNSRLHGGRPFNRD